MKISSNFIYITDRYIYLVLRDAEKLTKLLKKSELAIIDNSSNLSGSSLRLDGATKTLIYVGCRSVVNERSNLDNSTSCASPSHSLDVLRYHNHWQGILKTTTKQTADLLQQENREKDEEESSGRVFALENFVDREDEGRVEPGVR